MKKLWSEKSQLDKFVEAFETEGDLQMDNILMPYDILGSIAHTKMLFKMGIINKAELEKLEKGLNEISKLYEAGKFILELGDEDMHTKIENYLTEKYGEVGSPEKAASLRAGKKIHTFRSRNDQVLTALRLYSKNQILGLDKLLKTLIVSFKKFAKKYESIPLPGYSHMQKAMPFKVGFWALSFVAGFEDNLKILESVYKLNDQSPLGSAAGYGLPVKIDREYTAKLLGFSKVQENPLYCQNSRTKIEAATISALVSVLMDINKFASDIMLFSTSEFNFFTASSKVSTGSSIMPQKKNLDLAELLRSKVNLVLGNYVQVVSLSSNLPSGYNRDFQDSKKPLIESFQTTLSSLKAADILINNIEPNKEVLEAAMTEELYATEKALKLVKMGKSFRDAYREVASSLVESETHSVISSESEKSADETQNKSGDSSASPQNDKKRTSQMDKSVLNVNKKLKGGGKN